MLSAPCDELKETIFEITRCRSVLPVNIHVRHSEDSIGMLRRTQSSERMVSWSMKE